MENSHRNTGEHPKFDAICASLDEFEPLPEVAPTPPAPERKPDQDRDTGTIDEQILAGLVLP
jgi:hypothetical protein